MPTTLHVYTSEEIDLLLEGDRRQIDRLVLVSLNAITANLLPHMDREEEYLSILGPLEDLRTTMEWVKTQIALKKARTDMMNKVAGSAITWALISFLGFCGYVLWEWLKHNVHKQ